MQSLNCGQNYGQNAAGKRRRAGIGLTQSRFGTEKDGEPWFVAADVCRALEIVNPTDTIKKLDDDEKARFNLGLRGGDTNVVNEPGLYSLVRGNGRQVLFSCDGMRKDSGIRRT